MQDVEKIFCESVFLDVIDVKIVIFLSKCIDTNGKRCYNCIKWYSFGRWFVINGNVNSIEKYFSELFIFSGLEKEKLELIEKTVSWEIAEFSVGEKIYTPVEFEEKVGFIISGECSVEKMKPDGTTIPLNKLKKGDSFGILAVFSKSERFPTLVKSIKRSKILFFSKETVLSLVKTYPEVALAVITFMSDRIEFLNKKIATF